MVGILDLRGHRDDPKRDLQILAQAVDESLASADLKPLPEPAMAGKLKPCRL